MAKHSESRISRETREINMEIRYLHHKLAKVDRQIKLPESLTGTALLPLLEDPKPRKSNPRRFAPHVISWKSAATCAAAFALIVGLSAMLLRGTPPVDFVNGTIATTPPASQPDDVIAPLPPATPETDTSQQTAPPVQTAEHLPVVQPEVETSAPATPEENDTQSSAPVPDDGQGVGGQSPSVVLGEDTLYSYTYRANDSSDPAKAGYPITVNIIHISSGALAFTMDIPDMEQIVDYAVHGDALALVGTAQDSVTLRAYDLLLVGEPREMDAITLPGTLLDVRHAGDILYLFTMQDSPATAVTALPDATGDASCTVTAIDVTSMQRNSVAFSGVDSGLQLQCADGQATLTYADGQQTATVLLDGLEITLDVEEGIE